MSAPRNGGTDYNKWNKVTSNLLREAEEDDKQERKQAAEELGQTRVPYSAAQANEEAKARITQETKKALDEYQKRESNATAFLEMLFRSENEHKDQGSHKEIGMKSEVVVNESMLERKRVVSVRNCRGPGEIIFPSNLAKPDKKGQGENTSLPQGLIKIFIENCQDCTISLYCDIITSTVEICHCSSVIINIGKKRVSTIQADLCEKVTIRFHGENCFGGKDDRIYHAGVSKMRLQVLDEDVIKLNHSADYIKDGAVAQLESTAEEYQFVTYIVNNKFRTERLLRMGNKTLTQSEYNMIRQKNNNEKFTTGDLPSAEQISDLLDQCNTCKNDGNDAFKEGEYAQAILHYTMAIDKCEGLEGAQTVDLSKQPIEDDCHVFKEKYILFANRSACFLKLGHHDKALQDATTCVDLEPTYVKGLFRKGLAFHALGQYENAISEMSKAQKLEPKNKQIKQALQFAEVKLTMELRKRMD